MKLPRILTLILLCGLAACQAAASPPAAPSLTVPAATKSPPTPTSSPTATPTVTLTPTAEPTDYRAPTPHSLYYLTDMGITLNIPARKTDPFGDAIYSSDRQTIGWYWPMIPFDAKNSKKGLLLVRYPVTSLSVDEYPSQIKRELVASYTGVEEISTEDFVTDAGLEGKKVVYHYVEGQERTCAFYLFPHEWRGILVIQFCRFEAVKQGPNSTDDIDPVADGIVRSVNWLYDKQFFFGE
jgi:hypothetical protein